MKITGATHVHGSSLVPAPLASDEFLPEPCSSLSTNEMPPMDDIEPTSVSPALKSDESLSLQDELDFDEFLLDAAEWL